MSSLVRFFYLLLLFSFSCLHAQNELYINGDNILNTTNPDLFINGLDSVNPTLFIQGEVVNNQGEFVNNKGEIEITGNFNNNANGISAKFESNGIEVFSGSTNSLLSGNFSDTTGNINQFYALKIDKLDSSYFLLLGTNVHVNDSGFLEFKGKGIISTDSMNHSGNGADYNYFLYVRNPSSDAIIGHSIGTGATDRYIEGKLKREISDTNKYYFPIGVALGNIDGMEAFEIDFTSNSGLRTGLLAYIQEESSTTLGSSITSYADLGTHPGGASTGLDFSNDPGNCNSGDGILDRVILTLGQSHSWVVTPDIDTGTYSYDIDFYPGAALSSSASFYTCGSLELQYMMKDDIPGGDLALVGQGLPTFTNPGYLTAPNSSNSLSTQSSFSTFRNGGASLNGTTLPVELISLSASAVDNDYINVSWVTATEINNEGFQIQRSTDAINFENIGWVEGNGNTSATQSYLFQDVEVSKDILYYYRLKQLDFDGQYEYSAVVSASLKGGQNFSINVFPNPSNVTEELIVAISSSIQTPAEIRVYDVLGKLVISDQVDLIKGKNNYPLDNTLFATGQYFIVVNMNQKQYTKNVVVVEK